MSFLERLGISPIQSILDLGPDGWLSRTMVRYLELNPICLTTPRYLGGARLICSGEFQLICWNPPWMPFKTNCMDLVVGYHSLHLIPQDLWSELFSQIIDCLRIGGKLGLMMFSPDPSNPAQHAGLMGLELRGIPIIDPDRVLRILDRCGFSELKLELIQRRIQIPQDWIQIHIQRAMASRDESLKSRYLELVKIYGEDIPNGIMITGVKI